MSRTVFSRSVFAIVLFVLSAAFLYGQAAKTPKYDKATETTLKGTVGELKVVAGADEGTHFMLQDGEKAVILIQVGPEKYLKEIEVTFTKGDKVEIVGSKVKSTEGEDEILAREITQNGNVVVLRDKAGKPVWHGWKM